MKNKTEKLTHPFGAEFDAYSKILILGTFPSVKSRENMFYYGNPRNRFFKVLSALFNEEMPGDIPQKKAFLHKHHIAVFDVLRSCEICGSADTSIKNPVPNDFSAIFREANICAVFTNGKKAHELYNKYCAVLLGLEAVCLPSTSPANASASYEKLTAEWTIILNYLRV